MKSPDGTLSNAYLIDSQKERHSVLLQACMPVRTFPLGTCPHMEATLLFKKGELQQRSTQLGAGEYPSSQLAPLTLAMLEPHL